MYEGIELGIALLPKCHYYCPECEIGGGKMERLRGFVLLSCAEQLTYGLRFVS